MATVVGEPNPGDFILIINQIYSYNKSRFYEGFPLWTSAHGFHHISLTQSKGWKCFWIFLVTVLSIALFACIIFYFFYAFSSAVYTQIIQDAPASIPWPTTIVCDRQVWDWDSMQIFQDSVSILILFQKIFSSSKINQAQASLSTSHASILSFSIDPSLARPGKLSNLKE